MVINNPWNVITGKKYTVIVTKHKTESEDSSKTITVAIEEPPNLTTYHNMPFPASSTVATYLG